MTVRPARMHGRVPGSRPCAVAGCAEVGEYRAPGIRRPDFDGPGEVRWLCLDHVRAFNAGYDYFAGMDQDAILRAQTPYAGWERETRAFASTGADAPPRWSDFKDPMDAMGARFAHVRCRAEDKVAGIDPEVRAAFETLGLAPGADRKAIRSAYSALVRRYHPDRNGGDRRHERKLAAVVAAYQRLRASSALA